MRYALQVQYIGKNYAGSQIQFRNGCEIENLQTSRASLEDLFIKVTQSH